MKTSVSRSFDLVSYITHDEFADVVSKVLSIALDADHPRCLEAASLIAEWYGISETHEDVCEEPIDIISV